MSEAPVPAAVAVEEALVPDTLVLSAALVLAPAAPMVNWRWTAS